MRPRRLAKLTVCTENRPSLWTCTVIPISTVIRSGADVQPLCTIEHDSIASSSRGIPSPGYKSYLRKNPIHHTIQVFGYQDGNAARTRDCDIEPIETVQKFHSSRGFSIPHVTIKTGLTTPDGREELLTEYFCDHAGCPNVATQVLGCVAELRAVAVVCDEHVPKPKHGVFIRRCQGSRAA